MRSCGARTPYAGSLCGFLDEVIFSGENINDEQLVVMCHTEGVTIVWGYRQEAEDTTYTRIDLPGDLPSVNVIDEQDAGDGYQAVLVRRYCHTEGRSRMATEDEV